MNTSVRYVRRARTSQLADRALHKSTPTHTRTDLLALATTIALTRFELTFTLNPHTHAHTTARTHTHLTASHSRRVVPVHKTTPRPKLYSAARICDPLARDHAFRSGSGAGAPRNVGGMSGSCAGAGAAASAARGAAACAATGGAAAGAKKPLTRSEMTLATGAGARPPGHPR